MSFSDLRFGAAVFDDPHVHQSAWVCEAGYSPERVAGTRDLSTDVIWLSNLGYTMMRDSGLSRHARFRRSDFLREDMLRIVSCLGIDPEDGGEVSRVMAQIFAHVMHLGAKLDQIRDIPATALKIGLRERLFDVDLVLPEAIEMALREATQYYTPVERTVGMSSDSARRYKFSLPRIEHAQSIMSVPVPFSKAWKKVPTPRNQTPEAIHDWIDRVGCPMVVRVEVERFDSDANKLLNYGALPAFGGRAWVTSHELMQLTVFGDVNVKKAYACDEVVTPAKRLKGIMGLKNMHEVSFSAALYAENVWCAAASSLPPRFGGRGKTQRTFNPAAPFVRALDRVICFQAASKVDLMGMDVIGYGTGSVQVEIDEGVKDDEINDMVREAGLVPQCMDIGQPGEDSKGASDPLSVLQSLLLTGQTEQILSADKQVAGAAMGG